MQKKLILGTLLLSTLAQAAAPVRRKVAATEEPIQSDYRNGELTELCQKAIDQTQLAIDAIVKIPERERNFDNTTLAFESYETLLSDRTSPLIFMNAVSTKKKISEEGANCEIKAQAFNVKTFGRRDLYDTLRKQKPRNAHEKRLLEKTLEAFENNGLKLNDENLARLTVILTKISELESKFGQNLNRDATEVELSSAELKGVPKDAINRFKKTADGKRFKISTKVTDFSAVMENAQDEGARRKMLEAYYSRQGVVNTQLLEEAISLRQQAATLLGFKTWADYRLHAGRMASSSKIVMNFLDGLRDKLAERNRADLQQLLDFKKSLVPGASTLNAWDIPYFSYQLKKKNYNLDDEKIREYFPADSVVHEMFGIYSELLGVNYEQVIGAKTWAPDVKLYRIIDKKSSELIGYFYTDFIPRQGKYEHFAAFSLLSERLLPDGSRAKPTSAIVGNFTPGSGTKPSLLTHDEVETLFHEFGHIMHQTLTTAPYASLSGSAVARDFVEAPSQMLENWVWQPEILNRISGYYKNPSQKLPPELLASMIKARDFQRAYFYTKQLFYALLDMSYSSSGAKVDTTAVFEHLYKDILSIEPVKDGRFAAGFGHLMGGYDAGYYGYLWSDVYAADMFTVFEKEGLLSPDAGARYRQTILESGNMVDAQDLLKKFIGRAPNNKAFLKKLGIKN